MAFQRGLATTGHNIANAGTEGYSRQDIKLDTRYASLVEGGYIGNGVSVYDIERSYSAFLAKDYQIATSGLGKFETATRMANRLDNLIADQERGLASQIERFFNSLQDVSNNPTSIPERQVMLGEAQALVQQFQYLDAALGALNEEVNDQLESYVQEINTIAEDIAKLNDQISVARSKSAEGQEPNDLLDQRDRALLALSKLVAVTTSEQDEGVVNVLIGNGQPLVIGNRSEALSLNVGEFDPLIKDIAFKRTNGSETTITNFLTGGAIQGLIDFREGMLNSTRQQVGLLVTGLVTSINDQHRLGVDLKGELGGDFFSGGAPEVFSSLENTGLAQVEAVITDVKSLEPTNYELQYFGRDRWELQNLLTGQVFTSNTGAFDVEGLSIRVEQGIGPAIAGDKFLIRPNLRAPAFMGVAAAAPADIAAASPLKSAAALSNQGTANVASLQVTSANGLPLVEDVVLTFTADGGPEGEAGYRVQGAEPAFLAYDPVTDFAGKTLIFEGAGDATIEINGVPENGDTLTITRNLEGTGDNRNLLALMESQNKPLLQNGTVSFQDVFANTVSDVGIRTRQFQLGLETREVLHAQAEDAYKSKSGVNLDEEAANLLKYQQAYQAAAKVMSVADEMFQTLLASFR